MPKLYSAYYSERDPFGIFDTSVDTIAPHQLKNDGVLILWGGEDISPSLYGQAPVHTNAPPMPSRRDTIEVSLYKRAVELGMPIIGVCRGAQLACAMSGGTLYQHIKDGHHQPHQIDTFDDELFTTSSCHHQALNLTNVEHDLLAWDHARVTKSFTNTDSEEVTIPEVAYLHKHNVLAIQGHPEWMNPHDPFILWCNKQIKERFKCFHMA